MAKKGRQIAFAPYHSALHPEQTAPAVDRFEHAGSVALVHDITSNALPRDYDACDVLYTEMAWRPGYQRFIERAGASASTFVDYIAALVSVIQQSLMPVCMVTGPALVRYFPVPTQRLHLLFPDALHKGGRCEALVYRTNVCADLRYTTDLVLYLADRFRVVGDPCCGYGNTGRAFATRGGRFVLSDFNPRCIGWVALHAPSWFP